MCLSSTPSLPYTQCYDKQSSAVLPERSLKGPRGGESVPKVYLTLLFQRCHAMQTPLLCALRFTHPRATAPTYIYVGTPQSTLTLYCMTS